ncbi:MAG: SDR family oxidoreductase [Desulfomonilaceae bacterium]|nr:SDR family oxidoreductase [Desulfomonilaceae bacterium]
MNVLDFFRLSGKTAIVTGGGSGLGEVMARGLAEAGANLVLCSRKIERCEQAALDLARLGVQVIAVPCDQTKEEDVESVVRKTIERFGAVDILINNAGTTWGAAVEKMNYKDWQRVIDVNLSGTFLFSRQVGREMIERGGGKIINISSYAGLGGTDPDYLDAIPYNTSKGAIIVFTKDLAVKWAHYNINVNCIAPGWFPTKMTKWTLDNKRDSILQRVPIGRFGGSDDLKGAVVFLASRAADYITGQLLPVDGGMTSYA